jgi:hypothetical protein
LSVLLYHQRVAEIEIWSSCLEAEGMGATREQTGKGKHGGRWEKKNEKEEEEEVGMHCNTGRKCY